MSYDFYMYIRASPIFLYGLNRLRDRLGLNSIQETAELGFHKAFETPIPLDYLSSKAVIFVLLMNQSKRISIPEIEYVRLKKKLAFSLGIENRSFLKVFMELHVLYSLMPAKLRPIFLELIASLPASPEAARDKLIEFFDSL